MRQTHGGIGAVQVLTAGAAGAVGIDPHLPRQQTAVDAIRRGGSYIGIFVHERRCGSGLTKTPTIIAGTAGLLSRQARYDISPKSITGFTP